MSILVVGLTGQTGAGKTTVSAGFTRQGLPVVDCDLVARKVTQPGQPCLLEIARVFGSQVLDETGALRRRQVSRLIFADGKKKKEFEGLIFPYIMKEIRQEIARFKENGCPVVVLDAPTLFESGADRMCGKIVSVVAPQPVRVARIMSRDGIDRELALLRVNAQHSEDFFRTHSDWVVENGEGTEELERRTTQAVEQIRRWALENHHDGEQGA